MIICVTGKAGSGKTTVSRILKSAIKSSKIIDADIIDADILGKKLLSDSEIKKKLVIVFDNKILLKRKISRRKLAETAFSSTKNQKMLNSIVHPDIIKKIKSSAKSRKGIIKTTIIDAALFNELKLGEISDFTVLVKSKDNIVRKRIPENLFMRRKFQKEPKKPDFILQNNSDIPSLKKSALKISSKIMETEGKNGK